MSQKLLPGQWCSDGYPEPRSVLTVSPQYKLVILRPAFPECMSDNESLNSSVAHEVLSSRSLEKSEEKGELADK